MDSNRDDAQLCLTRAAAALTSGDPARAERLLAKSRRMYSKPPLSAQQDRLAAHLASQPPPAASAAPPRGPPRRAPPSPPPAREPSREMSDVVARVLRADDHYAVLGLARGATADDLRKAYRRLALALHPDKNVAPRAEEAFKRASRAWEVLGDPERRRMFDAFGVDDDGGVQQQPQRTRARRRRRPGAQGRQGYARPRSVEEEIDDLMNGMSPDEVFEFLFSSAYAQDNPPPFMPMGRARRAERDASGNQPSFWARGRPLTLFFVLFVILLMLSGGDDVRIPRFSLDPSYVHSVRRQTACSVPFYVSRAQMHEPSGKKEAQRLENAVHRTAGADLAAACEQEKVYLSKLVGWSRAVFSLSRSRKKYADMAENFRTHGMNRCKDLGRLSDCVNTLVT